MRQLDADVAAIFRALAECIGDEEKAIGAEWQPNMQPESSAAEARKVKRAERLETAVRLIAVLARRGQVAPLVRALEAIAADVSLADLVAELRKVPKQLELFAADVISLSERVQRYERRAEVLPLRRRDGA